MTALLDTHVLIWWLSDRTQLSPRQWEVIESATPEWPCIRVGHLPLGGGDARKPGPHSAGIAAA